MHDVGMRLQLALNVTDLDASVEYYSTMFGATPAKREPGYANFAIVDPPLKLVLFEVDGAPQDPGAADFHHLNHLGVETDDVDQVQVADARLTGGDVETTGVDDTVCCYAEKTETWSTSPDGARWEWYVKTGDASTIEHRSLTSDCC